MATLIFLFMMREATANEADCNGARHSHDGRDGGGEAVAPGAVRDAFGRVPSPGGDALPGRVFVLRREAAPGRGQGALRRGRHPGPRRAGPRYAERRPVVRRLREGLA